MTRVVGSLAVKVRLFELRTLVEVYHTRLYNIWHNHAIKSFNPPSFLETMLPI